MDGEMVDASTQAMITKSPGMVPIYAGSNPAPSIGPKTGQYCGSATSYSGL